MVNTSIIEQKDYYLRKETRNNLSFLSIILFVLILFTIPYIEDPDYDDKEKSYTKYNEET